MEEDRKVTRAIRRAKPALEAFIRELTPRFRSGGRLIYIGAGTSGRLGVMDAAEMYPTFQLPPGRIEAIIAGGDEALKRSVEGVEDDYYGACERLEYLQLTARDTLLGIATGGTTPFVLGALEWGKRLNPQLLTGLLACTPMKAPPFCDHLIVIKTGPEVVTGSTRMKAGTATKMVLNIISTTLMVQCGRVYQNLMVDLTAVNDKLRDRAIRMVGELTGLSREEAFQLLLQAGEQVKVAVVMHRLKVSRQEAERVLEESGGFLHRALGEEG